MCYNVSHFQLCESPPSSEHEKSSTNGDSTAAAAAGNNTIYSAPVSELGSTANLNKVAEGEEKTKGDKKKQQQSSKDHLKDTSSKNEVRSEKSLFSLLRCDDKWFDALCLF